MVSVLRSYDHDWRGFTAYLHAKVLLNSINDGLESEREGEKERERERERLRF